jgi:hypothetical protein
MLSWSRDLLHVNVFKQLSTDKEPYPQLVKALVNQHRALAPPPGMCDRHPGLLGRRRSSGLTRPERDEAVFSPE